VTSPAIWNYPYHRRALVDGSDAHRIGRCELIVLRRHRTMRIDTYRFGHVDIEGRGYDADVIIVPDHVQAHRWRQGEQRLAREDLATVLAEQPEVLVVGTGYYGRMQVPEDTRDALRDAGIDVRVADTGSAVETFNRLQQDCARIVAALHVTC
jgi:hypothetical protein